MRIAIEHRSAHASTQPAELIEIVTPRTNAAAITAAENLFAALAGTDAYSLEIAADARARWFLARAANPGGRARVEAQLAAAYPQAELRRPDPTHYPGLDPAWLGPNEQCVTCALVLRAPPYLPLRTFRDGELGSALARSPGPQADPLLGILGALASLPEGWRALTQLVLHRAPENWCQGYLRLAVESPLVREHAVRTHDTSLTSVFALAALLGLGALVSQADHWYVVGDWLHLALLALGGASAVAGLIWLARRLGGHPIYDPRLVQEKVSRLAYQAELRLSVFAPDRVPEADVRARLAGLASAYHQFGLAAGNALIPRPLHQRAQDLCSLAPILPNGTLPILNTRELAGLWHLPGAHSDVPRIERTTARRYLPLPSTVARGCRIGVSRRQGDAVPIALPDELLHRHLLLVAKTRRGKSSLLLRLALHVMQQRRPGGSPWALVLVDPHHDLARAALGLVSPPRQASVVHLDLANEEYPFGLNLLDVGLGWSRDQAVTNTLAVFRREFDRFWGPRMEDAFRFSLLTLYEVNQAICAADPSGRSRQYTLLDVPPLLVDPAFRRTVLGLVQDPVVKNWWTGYFDRLDRRLQLEIVNPVQTKVQRFAGSLASRAVVGQPASTIDPSAWLREGAVVIIDTAKGIVGEDTSALVGATLLNLVALAIAARVTVDDARRPPVTLIVDEFHSLPGTDYEALLAEHAKFGANLILATQSLATLDALDRFQQRALRATVFANLDGLFAFQTSAEDAAYLVHELGHELDAQDLVELGDFECYARLSSAGKRLPPFSLRLAPPPPSDSALAERLAAQSAERYGRERAAVERDLASALARIELAHETVWNQATPGQSDQGIAHDRPVGGSGQGGEAQTTASDGRRNRNQNRPPRSNPRQPTLFEGPGPETSVSQGDELLGDEGDRSPEAEEADRG